MSSTAKEIKKSILAGILIGLGVIINTQAEYKILGALLFSFGLLTIIHMKLNLFTGKIGYLNKFNQASLLPIILLYNLVGIAITISVYAYGNKDFIKII